jgi:gliding motility-associated protein GldM
MANTVLTPRQRMINMMYIVLTAMLALNVSSEILKAFHLVEVGLGRSAESIENRNVAVVSAIDKYCKEFENDVNAKAIRDRAHKVRTIAGGTVQYLETIKQQVVNGADGRKEDSNGDGKTDDEEVVQADNIEHHANLFLNEKKGEEVRKKIEETREGLLSVLDTNGQKRVATDLYTHDFTINGETQPWETVMFEQSPAAAVVTMLTEIQNDVRNTEAQVLDILKEGIAGTDFIVDQLEPKVIANSNYVTLGSEYSAEIFVAASSSKQDASITVNGNTIPVDKGIGKYKINPNKEGEYEYSGTITTRKPNGETVTYPFKQKYMAVRPMAVISATELNVVYVGLDNPISVSVPGYAASEIKVSSSAGKLEKGATAGQYLVKVDPSAGREITITASVRDERGGTKEMGKQTYRVRNVPKPLPSLGAIDASGSVSAGQLGATQYVLTPLKDFIYQNIKYTPTEYTIIYLPKNGPGRPYKGYGTAITPEIRNAFRAARSGDRVILAQVRADGPSGNVTLPTSLTLEVR